MRATVLLMILVATGVPPQKALAQCQIGQPGCEDPAFACSIAVDFKSKYGTPMLIAMVQSGKWSVSKASSVAKVFKAHCPNAL
jgi:hypothetical protein